MDRLHATTLERLDRCDTLVATMALEGVPLDGMASIAEQLERLRSVSQSARGRVKLSDSFLDLIDLGDTKAELFR